MATVVPPAWQTAEEVELQAWLATAPVEEVLEPALQICDPHHHLWDRERRVPGRAGVVESATELPIGFINYFGKLSPEYNQRFLFDELLALMTSGHNVVSTVYAQCGRFHSADSDDAFKEVAETAVVRGIQARFESGLYTNEFGSALRGCAGAFGTCDLTLGPEKVEAVLRAHMAAMPGFSGIRAATLYDPSPEIGFEVRCGKVRFLQEFDNHSQPAVSLPSCLLACPLHPMLITPAPIFIEPRLQRPPSLLCSSGLGLASRPAGRVTRIQIFWRALLSSRSLTCPSTTAAYTRRSARWSSWLAHSRR